MGWPKIKKYFISFFLCCTVIGNILARELTLDDFISEALTNNYDIRIIRQEVKEAGGTKRELWGNFFPAFSASYNQLYMDKVQQVDFEMPLVTPSGDIIYEKVDIEMGQKDIYEAKLSLQQPVFTFGAISNSYKISKKALNIQKKKQSRAKIELIPEVRKAFYRVIMAQDMVDIYQKQKELMEDNLKMANELYRSGKVSHLDTGRMEVQVARAKSGIVNTQSNLEKAREVLFNLAGMENSKPEIKGELIYKDFNFNLDELETRALKNRIELDIARRGTEIKKLKKKLSRSENLPKIYAYGNYTWEKPYQNRDEWGDYWTVGGRVEFPFLDGLSSLGRSKRREAALEKSKIYTDKLKAAIKLQLRNSFYSLREAEENIEVQEKNLDQLKENLKVARKRYSRGLIDSMELNQSVLEYTRGKKELTGSKFNYLSAAENLKIAVGDKLNTGQLR